MYTKVEAHQKFLNFEYNIVKKKKESSNTIKRLWSRIPYYFTNNLTAVLNKSSGSQSNIKIFWLFKKDRFIEIIIKDNDHTKMESPAVQYINDFINNEISKSALNESNIHTYTKYISYIDTALIMNKGDDEILYLFNKDKHIQLDLKKHTIKNGIHNKILNNGINIWGGKIGLDM